MSINHNTLSFNKISQWPFMQSFEANNGDGSYSVHSQEIPSALSPGFASQFYSFTKEKNDKSDIHNDSKQGKSIRALNSSQLADRSRDKDLQLQLEANQSRLYSLAKRIDECLSASKTNYTSSKVLQPSTSSLSKSSLSDPKETRLSEQVITDYKPNEVYEQPSMPQDMSTKSILGSVETTTEEISRDTRTKAKEAPKKSSIEPKSRTDRPPQQSRPVVETKAPLTKSDKMDKEKGSPKVFSSGLQKQLETVSSATIETLEDMGRPKERYVSPKAEKLNKYFTDEKSPSLEGNRSQLRDSRMEGSTETLSASKTKSPQHKPSLSHNRTPSAKVKETGSDIKQRVQQETPQSEKKAVTRFSEKPKPQKIEAKPTPVAQTKPVQRETPSNTIERKPSQKEQNKTTRPVSNTHANSQPKQREPVSRGNRNEPYSSVLKESLLKTPNQSSRSPDKSYGAMRDEDFLMTQAISPVLNETKSSKGATKDFLTPGYNFDMTHNLSINDTKNISFDSSMLGKDLSVRGGDNSRLKAKSGTSVNDQSKMRSSYKNNTSQIQGGKTEKSLHEEELESSFTKAFTLRKNKLINEVPNFEERMDSDIYFRRRFQNDLDRFLEEFKPKLTEDQAEELFERLVQDGRRREVRAHKFELHNQNNEKESVNKPIAKNEEQINQAFERLISDARKRMVLQEEQEKLKLMMQEELEKSQIKERSRSKMNREAEEKLVMKMTADAERRRLQYEKLQRAKLEQEIQEAQELQNQGFKITKNNKAKSKVKEYIESRIEPRSANPIKDKASATSKSFHITQKSRTPSPEPEVEVASPGLYARTYIDHKFSSPKRRYLNILSPANKSESNNFFQSPKKGSPNNESLSSLEYLQVLRNNINKHKIEIEDHIQTIKNIDSSSPLRSNPASPDKVLQPPQQARNVSRPEAISPQKERKKVTSRYDNVESKVAKHIEGKLIKQPQTQSVRDLKNQELPKNKANVSVSKAYMSANKASQREEQMDSRYNEQDSSKKRNPPQNQSKFMNDRAAISFVEKLINDFKLANKV